MTPGETRALPGLPCLPSPIEKLSTRTAPAEAGQLALACEQTPATVLLGLCGAYISKRLKFSRVGLRKDLGESTSAALGSGRAAGGAASATTAPAAAGRGSVRRALCPLPALPHLRPWPVSASPRDPASKPGAG